MKIKLEAPVGISEIGNLSRQEDKLFPLLNSMSASDRVFVMCDGLGGHAHGDVASAVVAKALGEWMMNNIDLSSQPTALTMRQAVAYAQQHLDDTNARFEASRYPMGTTMAMLAIGDFGAVAAHIGDTRVYHIRPSRREILYRSRDHSLVNDLFVAGRITRAEVEASPKKSVLSRAMLPAPCPVSKPDVAFITDIEAGDYFVLCTDGMIEAISDKKLKDVLCNTMYSNAQKVASLKLLTDTVPSNHSLMLLQVASVEKEAGDHLLVNTERLMCDKMVRRSVMLAPAVAVSTPSVEIKPSDDTIEEEIPLPPVTQDVSESAALAAEPLPSEGTPPVKPSTKPLATNDKKPSNRLLWMILAAMFLAVAIVAIVLLTTRKSGDDKVASETSKSEVSSDPDVIISKDVPNDVVPDEPLDTFPTGSNVAVTPAPTVSDIPTPNTRYDTGSNVRVPRVKEGDPYPDAFDNKDDYKDLEKDVPVVANDDDVVPAQPAQKNSGTVPPPPKKVNNDPTKSNRNIAVPPPPGRKPNGTPF